jgi:hypothetical protein
VAPDIGAIPEPEPVEHAQPAPASDSPVADALAAIKRAEEWQRQQQAQPADGLTEPQRQFLRQHPHVLQDPRTLAFYAKAAIDRGIPADTPQFFESILAGFQREYERGAEHAKHLAEMAQPHRAADKGREQAEEIIEHAQAMLPDVPLPAADTSPPPMSRPPPAAARRSVPVSAPVHRDVPTFSGNREAYVDTKLTAEERDIARRSFTAPDMTNEQKEYSYWVQREKLRRLRATGQYRQTTEQGGG